MANKYTINCGDTFKILIGGELPDGLWDEADSISGRDGYDEKRKPLSYAVREAKDVALKAAKLLASEQGVTITPYKGCDKPIVDDGRIGAAVANLCAAMDALKNKVASQPVASHRCRAWGDGCRRMVFKPGYCDRCAHDA